MYITKFVTATRFNVRCKQTLVGGGGNELACMNSRRDDDPHHSVVLGRIASNRPAKLLEDSGGMTTLLFVDPNAMAAGLRIVLPSEDLSLRHGECPDGDVRWQHFSRNPILFVRLQLLMSWQRSAQICRQGWLSQHSVQAMGIVSPRTNTKVPKFNTGERGRPALCEAFPVLVLRPQH
ncbi:hypothetical protein ON010_g16909 [Phytophthora cinnamomi]|nr:hypothetical protein ON010_g16909 [Phytophthora cinnamomi]